MKVYSGLGKELRLVQELGRAEVVESATERLVRQVGDRLQQRERDGLADDGGDLQEMLVLREQPVDARREDHLHGGRDLDRLNRVGHPIPSALPVQCLGLHQGSHGLLEEERVAALDQELLERRPARDPRRGAPRSSSPALSAGSASSRIWL